MPKRTYGYIGEERPERSSRRKKGGWSVLFSILFFPFKLVFYIIRSLFRGIFLVWEKSPSLSNKSKKMLRQRLLLISATAFVMCILGGIGFVVWASQGLPDPDKLTDRTVAQSTKIYDRTGKHLLYEVIAQDNGQKRTLITLDQVPKNLINGLIATEDKTFYQHSGVRPLSILRALVVGFFTSKPVAGTSTLTQQLVKNAILTNERSLTRKAKEIILSIRLEQKYSKDQILQIYFNEIPYGSTNYGVESAAESYFGKHVSDLSLAESATLAGFPKAPSTYMNNPTALKTRRDFVLARMADEGYITKEQKEAAQAEPLTIKQNFGSLKNAQHFVINVKQQLIDTYGEQAVERGGLNVITTLDWDKQMAAEKAMADNAKLLNDAGSNNAALVSLDPRTGQILAYVGSLNFNSSTINGQFDAVVSARRQPGSSFKPIIYAAAFEKGYTPDTVLTDVLTDFDATDNTYQPKDYDLGERGPITARYALQQSLNIPAVEMLYLVGQDTGVSFAERMGYTTLSTGNFGLSLVLGGGEVKLLEHTAAYGIFANNGIKQQTTSILSVETANGDILQQWKPKQGERVLDPTITATISNVLSDDVARAPVFGAGGVLTLPDRPVAAKTGTTNNYVDAWTMGYTPSLVTGVWSGNSNNTPMKQGYGGSKVAGQIWNQYMKAALKGSPVETFLDPPINDAQKPVLRGTAGGAVTLGVNKMTGKIATSSTPPEYIEQRTYTLPHTILYYVNKDDPRGPAPTDPTIDPQYTIWENAFQDWIQRKKAKEPNWNIQFEEPPTTYDDPQSSELLPSITILSPIDNSTINTRAFTTNVQVSAPRGVSQVKYAIDGIPVDTERTPPWQLHYTGTNLKNGQHTLTIRAEDDLGNGVEKTISFTLNTNEL